MDRTNLAVIFALAGGVFAICGACFEWEWFMNSWKAQRLVSWIGYDAARIFYGVLGIVFLILGTLMLLGVITNK